MVTVHPRYVVDENQQRKAVQISLAEWERIVDALEELDDIRSYDRANVGAQEVIPFDQAVREIEEDSAR